MKTLREDGVIRTTYKKIVQRKYLSMKTHYFKTAKENYVTNLKTCIFDTEILQNYISNCWKGYEKQNIYINSPVI